jgi:excisionase family DNA binding protein
MPPEPLISLRELAAYLQIPENTVYQWRLRGVGPPGFRVGRHLRFRMSDVEAWLDRRTAPKLSA